MATSDKIISLSDFKKLRSDGLKKKKIVFTNGCFDIVHLGHIDYLEKAKACGDRLIVAVNSDRSTTRYG